MKAFSGVLCVVLATTRIMVAMGLDEDLTDERVPPENQLDDRRLGRDMQIKYDEYPLVVPKRAALLLDRIMVALQKALEDDEVPPVAPASGRRGAPKNIQPQLLPLPRITARDDLNAAQYFRMDPVNVGLQRRGHTNNNNNSNPKGRVWRCYFNAVTCFRRK